MKVCVGKRSNRDGVGFTIDGEVDLGPEILNKPEAIFFNGKIYVRNGGDERLSGGRGGTVYLEPREIVGAIGPITPITL